MDGPIDLERLSEVFTEHPWLAEALSNGAWWGNCDGTVQVVAPVADPLAVREGLMAFAAALGCEATDVGVAPAGSASSEERPSPISARRVGTR